jgi:hypothetical protein
VRLAGLLRLSAIGIALMCWLDPPVVVRPRPPVVVSVAVARGGMEEAPESNEGRRTRREAADAVVERLRDRLGAAGDVTVTTVEEHRLPCGALEPCVVVTDATTAVVVPADRAEPVSVVEVGEPLSPNVALVGATAPRAHAAGSGSVRLTLAGRGVDGLTTRVTVRDGAALVGEGTHAWRGDETVELSVPWSPRTAGFTGLHLEARTAGVAERTLLDNDWQGHVEVTDGRMPVLVYERRPSSAVAVARRVLEADPRFELDARSDLASIVAAATPGGRLDAARLDRTRVVIAGAPEALTPADVDLLERFVHDRGGALVLVPDRRLEGPVTRLVFHRWRERLDREPRTAGELTAGEWLVADGVGEGDEVWLSADGAAAVVSSPAGAGQVVVVGAMDAWRYRERGRFDEFWRRLVAHLAEQAGAPLQISLSGGDRYRMAMHGRSVVRRTNWRATARLECTENAVHPVRLWPATAAGGFVAGFRSGTVGPGCVVAGAIDEIGEGRVAPGATMSAPGTGPDARETLQAAVRRTGGSWVTPADVDRLADELLARRGEPGNPQARYPMRSTWWLLPLMTCLAGEWWLRRRAGRR